MFSEFGINYAKEPEIFKRGNIFIRMSGDKKTKKREAKQLAKEKHAAK
jgi:tRNA(His) 5'-end guanylyltransferase